MGYILTVMYLIMGIISVVRLVKSIKEKEKDKYKILLDALLAVTWTICLTLDLMKNLGFN